MPPAAAAATLRPGPPAVGIVKPEDRSRLGDPVPGFEITLVVAAVTIAFRTSSGGRSPFCSKYNAATPVTCGAAIDVPDAMAVAVFEV